MNINAKNAEKYLNFNKECPTVRLLNARNLFANMKRKGEGDVHRIISKNIGLVFNGSGFYQTDYKNTHAAPPTATKSEPAPAPACAAAEGGSCCGCANNN